MNSSPRMRIQSTSTQVVTNLYEFLSSAAHKNKTFLRIRLTKQLMNPIGFHSMGGGSMRTISCFGYKDSYKKKKTSLLFNRRKKLIQVWENLRLSKWYIGWTIPLRRGVLWLSTLWTWLTIKQEGGEKPPQLILLHLGSHCCLALDKSPFFSLKHIDQYNKTILLLKGDVADKAQSSMKSITMASPVG